MTRRTLSTELRSTPTVRLTEKVGSRFVGRYINSKDVVINGKSVKIHELAAIEGDALITEKKNGAYVEATIAPGDSVALFGSKAIDTAVAQVNVGEKVEFIFNGQRSLKGGRRFNDIAVSIIEGVE